MHELEVQSTMVASSQRQAWIESNKKDSPLPLKSWTQKLGEEEDKGASVVEL